MFSGLKKGVYAITPDGSDTAQLIRNAEEALIAGVSCMQYRNKTADASLMLEQAGLLGALCKLYGTPLIINDRVDLVLAVDAEGVHLGGDDGSVAAARERLGEGKIIGASCYDSLELAERAKKDGATYIAFGAVHPSPTKPNAPHVSLDIFGQAARLELPRVAIGGITPDNGRPAVAAGADLLAAISGIFASHDITAAVRAYQQCFKEHDEN